MVSIIPLSIAQRRLDTGNAPQYSQGSPIGGAMQGFGDELSAIAVRYQQMKDQQEAFDAELARRRFNGQLAQAEDEVTANAPADGAGLHEAMYGQVDPRNGRVVKTGLFDTLFDAALPAMPESQRAAFARQKETMRQTGALRMAQRQLQRRKDYEQAQVDTALKTSAIAIGKANPDDPVSFEAARQEGFDLIEKMGLDPGIRQQKVKDWFSTAAKMRFEALIAKDPKRALEMFGVGTPAAGSGATSDTVQAAGPSGEGDRVVKRTPDEAVAQAFGDRAAAPMAIKPATDHLADLSPNDIQRLIDQAHAASTAQLIEARTSVALASQNAPEAIANTGSYSGTMPGPADFAAIYGAEEGGKQYRDFARKIDVGRQAFGMRTMLNQAIHATLRDAEPGPGSSEEERARFRTTAAAALKALGMRRVDPAGYVRKVFPNVDAAWGKITRPDSGSWDRRGEPDSYDPTASGNAIALSVTAQKQLGIESFQPLPWSVVQNVVATFNDESVAQADKDTILRSLFGGAPDLRVRTALAQQLVQAGLFEAAQSKPPKAVVAPAVNDGTSQQPSSPRERSAFDDFVDDLVDTPRRIKNDTAQFFRDLHDDPLEAIVALSNSMPNPASGAPSEGIAALKAFGQAVTNMLATTRSGTFAKPLAEVLSEGEDLYQGIDDLSKRPSDLVAEGKVAEDVLGKSADEAVRPKVAADLPSGSFSISDWTGYPALVPKPEGPFRLLESTEYSAARNAADKANRIIRRKQGLVRQSVDVHEINPVKFGGSPIDTSNKIVLPREVHRQQATPWWNQLLKDLGG